MKKYYGIVLFTLLAIQAYSQITIGQSDMPQAGDTIRLSTTTDTTGLPNFANTGANYTWNYTALTPKSQTIDTFLSVSSTPIAYQIFFNDVFLYPNYVSTVAQTAPNPPSIPSLTITNTINYYRDVSSAYENVGLGEDINSLPTSVKDDSIDYVYHFPMNYGNADSCNSSYHIAIPSFGYYGNRQHRVNHVDGWGTLKTPYGTFSALRVTTTLTATDSIYSTALTFGITLPVPEQLQYKWFVVGQHVPVLQVNENVVFNIPIFSNIVYRDSAKVILGMAQINSTLNGIKVFPNPAQNSINVGSQVALTNAAISLYNVMGQVVMQNYIAKLDAGNTFAFDISALTPGNYFLKVMSGSSVATFKITKE